MTGGNWGAHSTKLSTDVLLANVLDEDFGPGFKGNDESQWIILAGWALWMFLRVDLSWSAGRSRSRAGWGPFAVLKPKVAVATSATSCHSFSATTRVDERPERR